jgi:hypothetical protein
LFFGRPKVKKLVWGSQRIYRAQAKKFCNVADKFLSH